MYRLRFCFSNKQPFRISKTVTDCLLLHGTSTDFPFVRIRGKECPLTQASNEENAFIYRDKDYQLYIPNQSLESIFRQSFFIELSDTGEVYYVVRNQSHLDEYNHSQFYSTQCCPILQNPCLDTIDKLNNKQSLTANELHSLLTANLLRNAPMLTLQKKRFKQLLKVIDERISTMQALIAVVDAKLAQKAQNRMKWLMRGIVAQIGLLHYFVYVTLSWDIMEPVTVILANVDIFLAYCYFLKYGKDYSFENYRQSFIQRNRRNQLIRSGIDVQQYEDLLSIRDYVRGRLGILSKNPVEVLNTLSKPIKLIKE